jgi:hypothetical protein
MVRGIAITLSCRPRWPKLRFHAQINHTPSMLLVIHVLSVLLRLNKVDHVLVHLAVLVCLHDKWVTQRLVGCNALRRVALEQSIQELNSLFLLLVKLLLRLVLVAGTACAPEDDLFQGVTALAVAGNVCLKYLAMEDSGLAHLLSPEDGRDLQKCINVVCTVEEWKATGQHGQEDDADTPHVERTCLLCAFEQHLRCTETTRTRSIGPTAAAGVVLGIAGGVVAGLLSLRIHAVGNFVAAVFVRKMASAVMPVSALTFGETKVNENTTRQGGIVEEVGRLDIAVDNLLCVYCSQRGEEAPEVESHLGDLHVTVVVSEVGVLEVGQHSNDLVKATEGGDQRTYRVGVSQVVEQLELVEYAYGTAGDIDLLDGDVVGSARGVSPTARRRPLSVLAFIEVPAVVELVVLQVLGLVDGGKGTCQTCEPPRCPAYDTPMV